jgi:hypothetical protein
MLSFLDEYHKTSLPGYLFHYPGINVMITIFGDLGQFSANNLPIFLKTNAMIFDLCS